MFFNAMFSVVAVKKDAEAVAVEESPEPGSQPTQCGW